MKFKELDDLIKSVLSSNKKNRYYNSVIRRQQEKPSGIRKNYTTLSSLNK